MAEQTCHHPCPGMRGAPHAYQYGHCTGPAPGSGDLPPGYIETLYIAQRMTPAGPMNPRGWKAVGEFERADDAWHEIDGWLGDFPDDSPEQYRVVEKTTTVAFRQVAR